MNIYLVDLEAVQTRYTAQWKSHVPKILQAQGHQVQVISGPEDIPSATTPGAFLNFGGLISISLAKLKRLLVFLPPEPLIPTTILFLLIVGTQGL